MRDQCEPVVKAKRTQTEHKGYELECRSELKVAFSSRGRKSVGTSSETFRRQVGTESERRSELQVTFSSRGRNSVGTDSETFRRQVGTSGRVCLS